MRKLIKILGLTIVLLAILTVSLASTCKENGSLGPNPNAGDGISDGSSLDSPNIPWYLITTHDYPISFLVKIVFYDHALSSGCFLLHGKCTTNDVKSRTFFRIDNKYSNFAEK